MSGHGASVSGESPYKQRIPCKNKRNNSLNTLIKRKEIIQEIYNPSKSSKEDIIPDLEKNNPKKHINHLKISKTILVILIRRRVVPMIIQVKLMLV